MQQTPGLTPQPVCEPLRFYGEPTKIILKNILSPGDTIAGTVVAHALARLYPGKYRIDVRGVVADEVYDHNPDVKPIPDGAGRVIDLRSDGTSCSGETPVSLMQTFCDYVADELNLSELSCQSPRPLLYLGNFEKESRPWFLPSEPLWVLNAGYKDCYETKWYSRYSEVVAILLDAGIKIVQVGERSPGHHHEPIEGCMNLIGKTSARRLIWIVGHAQGVISPVSFLYWIAAGLQKPAIVCDSAREPITFFSTPSLVSMMRHNSLPCCAGVSCWKTKILSGNLNDRCVRPIDRNGRTTTSCLDLIEPSEIAQRVLEIDRGLS